MLELGRQTPVDRARRPVVVPVHALLVLAGNVFTIEPMINAGDWRDETWPDGWTAVTRDGKRSAQYEHTMVVTSDGVEILTRRNEDSPRVFPWTDGESEGVVPGS